MLKHKKEFRTQLWTQTQSHADTHTHTDTFVLLCPLNRINQCAPRNVRPDVHYFRFAFVYTPFVRRGSLWDSTNINETESHKFKRAHENEKQCHSIQLFFVLGHTSRVHLSVRHAEIGPNRVYIYIYISRTAKPKPKHIQLKIYIPYPLNLSGIQRKCVNVWNMCMDIFFLLFSCVFPEGQLSFEVLSVWLKEFAQYFTCTRISVWTANDAAIQNSS